MQGRRQNAQVERRLTPPSCGRPAAITPSDVDDDTHHHIEYDGPSATSSTTALSTTSTTAPSTTSLEMTGPGSTVAGTRVDVQLAAYDAFGNVATGYTGQVHFTSDDPQADVPDYVFTAADAGLHHFAGGVVLKTAGSRTVTATDVAVAALTAFQRVTVTPAAASQVVVEVQNSENYKAFSGGPFPGLGGCGATAKDPFGNVTPSTQLAWSSTDPWAVLPQFDPNPFFFFCNFATVGNADRDRGRCVRRVGQGHGDGQRDRRAEGQPERGDRAGPDARLGRTRWLINVLRDDEQTRPYIFNPWLTSTTRSTT